jgi:predicted nuclease with TOPRIM domain
VKLQQLNYELAQLQEKSAQLSKEKHRLESVRVGNDRAAKLQRLTKERNSFVELNNSMQQYAACDPERIELLQKNTKIAKDAANRWTDNIFILKNYIEGKNPGIEFKNILKEFNLPAELDNID